MTRTKLITLAVDNLTKMGLEVFKAGVNYRGLKPDLVIVYPDKQKYYMAEIITEECLVTTTSAYRLYPKGGDTDSREFCSKLYPAPRDAAWAAAVYCDLGQGLELFEYKELGKIKIDKMQRYAALIYRNDLKSEADKMLGEFKLVYKSLNVLDQFTLTLLSQPDTAKLADARRFMQFLVSNRVN